MVIATLAICILSFTVWLHHFFTMGAGADVNAVFGLMSMLIGIPTGVKIFNWLFTMWAGRVRFETPMLWAIGFMFTFVIGGMTGVLLAVPPADFVLHNSLFLIAHFHNVIIAGVLFGVFAGYTYWFPKAFGFKLEKRFGTAAFWFWLTGFYVTFMPLYVVGLEGMTRRMQHYDVAEWRPWLLISAVGSVLVLAGILCQIAQIAVSIRERAALRDRTGDPWDGRTLEWMTASPPPAFNFAAMPDVTREEAYWTIKQRALARAELSPMPQYAAIEMPMNSPTGFVVAFFAVVTGFALIWHIFWLAAVGVAGAFATFVVFAWRDFDEYEVPVEEVRRIDALRREAREDLVAGREPGIRLVKVPAEKHDTTGVVYPSASGPAQKRIVTGYGFWVFLLSDFVMFSGFYSAYAVLSHATAGGPGPLDLFNIRVVAAETAFLLLSSFVCGLAMVAANQRNLLWTEVAFLVAGLFGLGFLALELNEFAKMIALGAGPGRSAFLSAFFALVGCHGLHVTIGLMWLGTMMAQIFTKGFKPSIMRRTLCFALFWHALDIIWIGIFTNVYLLGTLA